MKNKFLIAVTGSRKLLVKVFVDMLNRLGHTAMGLTVDELLSYSLKKADLPQLIFITSSKNDKYEIETTRDLKRLHPEIPVIIITMDENIQEIIQGIKAGVHGYVLVISEPKKLDQAVNTVAGNNDYFFDLTNEILIYSNKDDIANPINKNAITSLNDTYKEFLRLLTTELDYNEMAQKMGVTTKIIQGYKKHLASILKIQSRVGMVLFAVKNNLASVE